MAFRNLLGEPASEIGNAIPGQRRDHKSRSESHALVGRLGNSEQRRFFDEIDFVDEQDFALSDGSEAVKYGIGFLVEAALGVDQHGRDIGVIHPGPGRRDHGAVKPPLGRKNAGGIDEYKLRLVHGRNAA